MVVVCRVGWVWLLLLSTRGGDLQDPRTRCSYLTDFTAASRLYALTSVIAKLSFMAGRTDNLVTLCEVEQALVIPGEPLISWRHGGVKAGIGS